MTITNNIARDERASFRTHTHTHTHTRNQSRKNMTSAQKTWKNFKSHHKEYYSEYLDEQANCHSAGIANSATAALADAQATIASQDNHLAAVLAQNVALQAILDGQSQCPTVPPLIQTSTISNSTSELTGDVLSLKQELAQLKAAMAAQVHRPPLASIQEPRPNSKPYNRIRPPRGNRSTRFFNNSNYCWSHGFDIGPSHTSATCRNPKHGHKKEATVTNQMGGDQTNCHLIPK